MMQLSEKFFSFLFLLIPLFLITGPALPDIVITLSLIFGIIYFFYIKKYSELIKINFFRISILFWLSLIFISFFSYNKTNSFQDAIIFIRFLFIPILCYFIFFKKRELFKQILLVVTITVIFVCVDSLYQFLNYTPENGFGKDLLGFESNWYGRLTGPFGDELIPGSYISKFGLLGFAYLISIKRYENKIIFHSIYLSSILFISFISGERMAFATFGLGLIFLFLFLDGFRKSIFLSIIISILLIFLATYLHPSYNDFEVIESTQYHQGKKIEKFFDCIDDKEKICSKIIDIQPSFYEILKNFKTSAYGEIYLLSFKMFLDNPVTGVGINNFKFLCNDNDTYQKMMVHYECASHPHNIHIQWITEGGLIVFVLFIMYLIFLIFFIKNNTGEKKYKIISIAIIIIMFWPIMSTGSLIKNWFGVSTFFIVGLCMCLSKFRNNSEN
ncbi:O-antigen ligase family protein [Pelagibacteraceae bacterium]|nr:O-antigen ligase family protein [Pelagibacteraceae bacterium]